MPKTITILAFVPFARINELDFVIFPFGPFGKTEQKTIFIVPQIRIEWTHGTSFWFCVVWHMYNGNIQNI